VEVIHKKNVARSGDKIISIIFLVASFYISFDYLLEIRIKYGYFDKKIRPKKKLLAMSQTQPPTSLVTSLSLVQWVGWLPGWLDDSVDDLVDDLVLVQ
jgi:hypothetical protein